VLVTRDTDGNCTSRALSMRTKKLNQPAHKCSRT
jgi:hypothetical protein